MVAIALLNPIDQSTGRRRLLTELRDGMQNTAFTTLRMVVAFAKSGPLLRLEAAIKSQRARGLQIEAVFGVDQFGTSAQALRFALDHFDLVHVTREPNRTFHSKIYMFEGATQARAYVGSHNLTVGGTETNFEASLRIDFALPADEVTFDPFRTSWNELLPANCVATKPLTAALLDDLVQKGIVLDETKMRKAAAGPPGGPYPSPPPRSGLAVLPPSALPKRKVVPPVQAAQAPAAPAPAQAPAAAPVAGGAQGLGAAANLPFAAQGLAIQIKPHHNGELLLSVTAALQNPAFFKWPFNGLTVPKLGSNKAYPQLTPDPVANIAVYSAGSAPVLTLNSYALNTVYYQRKSEIRITASPLVGIVPDYSIMVMEQSSIPGIDYDIVIHTPASPDYTPWLAACNQQMPGGGAAPRRFGWF
ncbi:MAG: restriction endonuclease [Mesorhizobium sp.]|uniref:phospholipase D family protein n=1 Tax=Mesorhizobium sp. TaxID=1871066 RepID=UPI000FEAADB9|nr:phospholipase D family protein [Mesorhizobium sp.]RWM96178.1 MAG: restriction endonuclease [Mesorhizobium sp.]